MQELSRVAVFRVRLSCIASAFILLGASACVHRDVTIPSAELERARGELVANERAIVESSDGPSDGSRRRGGPDAIGVDAPRRLGIEQLSSDRSMLLRGRQPRDGLPCGRPRVSA